MLIVPGMLGDGVRVVNSGRLKSNVRKDTTYFNTAILFEYQVHK
jgi:hypothetical protein